MSTPRTPSCRSIAPPSGIIRLVVLAVVAASCSGGGRELRQSSPGQGESIAIVTTTIETTTIEVTPVEQPTIFSVSGTWLDGGALDPRHTCAGANTSPALTITNVPVGSASLAITLVDLAAPYTPLWVMANIGPTETVIQEGGVPAGAIVGATGAGTPGYNGPCPADGQMHEYLLIVYALDQMLEFTPDPNSLDDSRLLLETIRAGAFDSAETRFFAQTT